MVVPILMQGKFTEIVGIFETADKSLKKQLLNTLANIDLANINSCSFIATQDLGKKYPNNSFEVLGRFDNSDIRGCNLMVV